MSEINISEADITKCIETLREQIFCYLAKTGRSICVTAELCGINRNELGEIINRKKKDVRLSTLCLLSQGTEIPISILIGIEEVHQNPDTVFLGHMYASIKSYMEKGRC